MPEQKLPSAKVCEESIIELHAQAKRFSEHVHHLLDGNPPPEATQRAIAVIVDGKRARAYINRVSCTFDDRIVCWATAIPENSPDTRHWVDLTFRNGHWNISIKRSFAVAGDEDFRELTY